MKRQAGFTLVEMMVGVAVLAILLAVAVPSFQVFIRNTQIRTAAESMQAGLHLARSEALRRNARVTLWMVSTPDASCARSSSGTSWVVSIDDPASSCNAAASDTVAPRLIQLRAGADGSPNVTVGALNAAGAAADCVTFNGFGGVEAACAGAAPIAAIALRSAGSLSGTRGLDVRVSSGGAIRQCDPNAGPDDVARC